MNHTEQNKKNIFSKSTSTIFLRLFVAGEEHNSKIARSNLDNLLSRVSIENCEVIIIDVIENLQKAVEYGVIVTPMLQIETSNQTHVVYGNLSDLDKITPLLKVD